MFRVPGIPSKGGELGKGRSKELTGPQRELHHLSIIWLAEINVQCPNAFRVFGCGERFECEVPFAWIPPAGPEPPADPIARTAQMYQSPPTGIHRDVQGGSLTSFNTHLDEPSAIVSFCKDGGPYAGLVNEHRPPEPANVRQVREPVHAFSGAWRSEDLEKNFGRDFVNEVPCSVEPLRIA